MSRYLRVSLLGVVVGLLILTGWFWIVMPNVLASHVQSAVRQRLGRDLDYLGGTQLRYFPNPSITLKDVRLSGASSLAAPVLNAETLTVPMSVVQLLSGRASVDELSLDHADVNLNISSLGHSNVIIDAPASDAKTDANAPPPRAMHINLTNSSLHYRDEMRNLGFVVSDMTGLIDVDADDQISIKGDGTMAGERGHFSGALKSLPRAFGEGSPLDFNLEAAGAAFDFSGRVVATQGLDLAGQATFDSKDAKRSLKWLGVTLHGLQQGQPLAISGAVENQGPLFLMKKMDVAFAKMKATGDISFSNAGEKPRLTLALGADVLNFNVYGDAAKPARDNWDDRPFDLSDVTAADVQFRLAANQLAYGAVKIANSKIEGEIKDGVLSAHLVNDQAGKMDVTFDGKATLPKLDINFGLSKMDAQAFLSHLMGWNWLSGAFNVNGSLTATGSSAAAMVGALNGAVDVQIDQSKITGAELAGLAAHVTTEPVSGWEGALTEPVSANAHFDFDDGVAKWGEAALTAPGVKIMPSGEIDVLRQALAMQSDVTLNRGDGKPARISVNGPWGRPQFKAGN